MSLSFQKSGTVKVGRYSWHRTSKTHTNETKMELAPGGLFAIGLEQATATEHESAFIAAAQQFIALAFSSKLEDLNSQAVLLSAKELPNSAGFKVSFKQKVGQFDVHNGSIQVFLRTSQNEADRQIEVYRYTSSLIEAKMLRNSSFGISTPTAKRMAKMALTKQLKLKVTACLKQLNPYRGWYQPIYRLQLEEATSTKLRRRFEVILRGQDGKLVFARELEPGCLPKSKHNAANISAIPAAITSQNQNSEVPNRTNNSDDSSLSTNNDTNNIAAQSLVDLPMAGKSIASQFRTIAFDLDFFRKIKGRLVLANRWIEVYWTPRRTDNKVDWQLVGTTGNGERGGTFEWEESTPQAKGVVLYYTLTEEFKFLSECGLKIPADSIIKCYPDHPWNPNNATFFGKELIMQIGIGNGSSMAEHIVYDLIVVLHEGAHAYVQFMREKDHWLYGPQGEALNEAIADIIASTMHYLFWLKHGQSLGNEISLSKLLADNGVIGSFALGEKGFRQLENSLVYPADLKSDQKVHENCKIVGAAMFHTFKHCLNNLSTTPGFETALAKLIKDFVVLLTTAIPMLPTNRVTFSDWRTALEDADAVLFNKAHQTAIESGFTRHGINR